MNKIPEKNSAQDGQSVMEIVIALAIFVMFSASTAALILGGFSLLERGEEFTIAAALAREGVEATRSVRDRDWEEFAYSRSAVAVSGGQWALSGEGTTETIGDFVRVIDFYPVYRDGSGNIAAADDPGASLDASSVKVTVGIFWETGQGINESVERTTYLTDWR
ncbi:hypothetical protein A2303_01780 [Candidatus Falkowbacteria bacterium RIFOXYB2_FULL_47_14]|uniref:Type 4 fimbrial biogenesis protein PilX N-terminal domain-containing protein n=1 Tax=Candidatus Falkowbacteria bacterium RIFOXYA2_FULL_47_19 TaxID=1797994 RepID=A0A1F5SKQ8_9BACT|nr:MAG: hypothetical protein A2227_06155 [Candidatus Falkowbacteria bacterium RIFOXYA2_FULL_47_19]OGF37096.1 MAG: hypothetical protein A2468_05345 [Candidatus Falkowbacteria bacterium RIFOXYC2_FULL_46_15]OGF43244.1 MAG: hypothetical protein A2303_01780 [Candidatus Falkowbacteria bacterium RIFOXYB2_FULL_47_14]